MNMGHRRFPAVVLLAVAAGLALLAVWAHHEYMAEYGDVTGIGPKGFSRDCADWEWTASYTGVALIPVVIAAVFAFILASRRWMRVTAVAIPVLMLLGILAVTPVGLQKRLDAQYDSAPQCVNQDMGGTVSAAGWQVVEDDRLHLRALRDGLAFEVIPCTGGGIIWAGKNESCGAPCD